VPVATLTGEPANNPFPRPLSGTTAPCSQAGLSAMDPTQAGFTLKRTTSTLRLERQSYLSPAARGQPDQGARGQPDQGARGLSGPRMRI
jgi:hypothetical protein